MPKARVNGLNFYYELMGSGDPLVLVHGSWGDHESWQSVVAGFQSSFQLLTYDRRGHSQSEHSQGQGYRLQDEQDLAGLMEALDLAPAHVAGNSFGASIVLGLAARRTELFRSVIVHEPSLMTLVAGDRQLQPVMEELNDRIEAVVAQLEAGDISGGTRRFVEEVTYGPGTWEQLPVEVRQSFMRNALTFVDEQRDPGWADLDGTSLSSFHKPALLTQGAKSPPWFPKIMNKLGEAMPHAERLTFPGAGHAPHRTHSTSYVKTLTQFIHRTVRTR